MVLLDMAQGVLLDFGVPHDQMAVAAIFGNVDLRNASSGCDTTNMQLFCPNLLHNITNPLGHITNMTSDCSGAK